MYCYKVLLADDETEILSGISDILNKECDNIEIVAHCTNGSQVLDYLRNNTVDIVVSDICMPGVSGIEIAKYIKETNQDTHIILITGFRKFEYAADAIKYNVSKFITKPIDFDELIEAINSVKNNLSEKRMASVLESQNILRNRDAYRMQLLLLINGIIEGVNDKLLEDDINKKPCAFIEFTNNKENHEVADSIWQYMCEIEDEVKNVFCVKEDASGATLLILFKNIDIENIQDVAEKYADSIKKLMHNAYDINSQYKISYYGNISDVSIHNFDSLAGLYVDYLSKNNYAAKTDFINIICSSFNFDMLKSFLLGVIRMIDSINIPTSKVRDAVLSAHNKTDLFDALSLIDELVKNDADNSNERIVSIKNYISNHFDSNISLLAVAEAFDLNPSYLSRIFKNATGMRIGNYIMSVRMEKAKQLISNKCDIVEAAKRVGYNNLSYFNKIFKDYTGVMPTQYAGFGGKNINGGKTKKK